MESLKKFVVKHPLVCSFVLFSAITMASSPAKASEWEDVISQVADFRDAITDMITGFATVAVTPIGMSAAIKLFRHVVLNNV